MLCAICGQDVQQLTKKVADMEAIMRKGFGSILCCLEDWLLLIIVSIDCRHICEFEQVLTISCAESSEEGRRSRGPVASWCVVHDTRMASLLASYPGWTQAEEEKKLEQLEKKIEKMQKREESL